MKRKLFSIVLTLAVLLAVTGVMAAQATPGSLIDWFAVAGGGGSASGGNITLESTVGQPIVGLSEGGSVSLGAGYWVAGQPAQIYLPLLRR